MTLATLMAGPVGWVARAATLLSSTADEQASRSRASGIYGQKNELRTSLGLPALDFAAAGADTKPIADMVGSMGVDTETTTKIVSGFARIGEALMRVSDAQTAQAQLRSWQQMSGIPAAFGLMQPKEEKVEVVVRLEGVTDGAEVTQVKATSGVRAKVSGGGVGVRTTSHLKGSR